MENKKKAPRPRARVWRVQGPLNAPLAFVADLTPRLLGQLSVALLSLEKCDNCTGTRAHYLLVMKPMYVFEFRNGITARIPILNEEPVVIATVSSLEDMETIVAFLGKLPKITDSLELVLNEAKWLHSTGELPLRSTLPWRLRYVAKAVVMYGGAVGLITLKVAVLPVYITLLLLVTLLRGVERLVRICFAAVGLLRLAFIFTVEVDSRGKILRVVSKVDAAEHRMKSLHFVKGARIHILEAVREARERGDDTFFVDIVYKKDHLACRDWHLPPVEPDITIEFGGLLLFRVIPPTPTT